MRKIYLKLSILIISLLAVVAAGRVFIPDIFAAAATSGPDVDLSEYYVFKVNPTQIYSVTYKTKSQSGMRPQTYDADGVRWYLIPSAEAPVSFSITPSINSAGVLHSIKSIKDDTGKTYTSYPRGTVLNASAVSAGTTLTVESDVADNILTGTFVIETLDEPTDLQVVLMTPSYNKVYTWEAFKNKKLEVKYDPATENEWAFVRVDSNNESKMIALAKLDGEKLSRKYLMIPGVTPSSTLVRGFNFRL